MTPERLKQLQDINDSLQDATHDVVIKGRPRQDDLFQQLERLSDFVFNEAHSKEHMRQKG